jgi:predicted sulfurtransferase
MKQKINSNAIKEDNIRLRTRIQALESELYKKEKFVDDMILARHEGNNNKFNKMSVEVRSHLIKVSFGVNSQKISQRTEE